MDSVSILTIAVILGMAFLLNHSPAVVAATKKPPTDLCMLLSAAEVKRAIGQALSQRRDTMLKVLASAPLPRGAISR